MSDVQCAAAEGQPSVVLQSVPVEIERCYVHLCQGFMQGLSEALMLYDAFNQ